MADPSFRSALSTMTTPWGLLLALLYLAAFGVFLYQRDFKGLLLGLGTTVFALLLALLALKLTEGRAMPVAGVVWPWLGLGIWLVLELASSWLEQSELFPRLTVWNLEVGDAVLRKLLLYGLIPLIFLWIKGDALQSMGLTLDHWRADLKLALILGGIGFVPILLFGYLSWGATLFQQVTPDKALLGFPVAFVFYLLHTGLPEEVFFRAYLQGHLGAILHSKIGAITLAGLISGLLHILFWRTQGQALPAAFAYAMLTQVSVALLFGVLWEQTRSLLPLVLLHSWIDALLGLGYVVQRVPMLANGP